MVTRDFSGEDVYKVLVNKGNFTHVRTKGDHLMLRWTPPEPRQVTVPLHDRIRTGPLRAIAADAGARISMDSAVGSTGTGSDCVAYHLQYPPSSGAAVEDVLSAVRDAGLDVETAASG